MSVLCKTDYMRNLAVLAISAYILLKQIYRLADILYKTSCCEKISLKFILELFHFPAEE